MQFQDVLKKIPSIPHFSPDGPDGEDADKGVGDGQGGHIPRVGSLDYLRAYLHSRQRGENEASNKDVKASGVAAPVAEVMNMVTSAPAVPPPIPATSCVVNPAIFGLPGESCLPIGTNPFVLPGAGAGAGADAGAGAQVSPLMLPYIAAMNAAAMMNLSVPSVPPVPTAAVGGNFMEGKGSGYSSGEGNATATALAKRGNSGHSGQGHSGQGHSDVVMTDDKVRARRERRMLSNRESARRSRKRKQEHLAELEQQLAAIAAEKAEIAAELASARDEIFRQRSEISSLQADNESLKRQLAVSNESLK